MRAFRSEWLKLRRRGMAFAAALTVFLGGLTTFFSMRALSRIGFGDAGPAAAGQFARQAAAGDGLARIIARGGTLYGVIALVIFALAVTSEYSNGTLSNLLVREPRRLRVLGGKLAATASFMALAVLAAFIVSTGIGLLMAPGAGIARSAWTSSFAFRALTVAAGDTIGATIGWGVFGAVLGLLLRSPAPAIGAGLAYALPFEPILLLQWTSGRRWLPGQLLQIVAIGGTPGVSFWRAASLVTLYAAVALTLASVSFVRRDVTA